MVRPFSLATTPPLIYQKITVTQQPNEINPF
jgi:hypothetical protein